MHLSTNVGIQIREVADQRSEHKIVSHRRKPVPTVGMDPGFRREDDDGRVALDRPNESER
jgi:hypothetical protein